MMGFFQFPLVNPLPTLQSAWVYIGSHLWKLSCSKTEPITPWSGSNLPTTQPQKIIPLQTGYPHHTPLLVKNRWNAWEIQHPLCYESKMVSWVLWHHRDCNTKLIMSSVRCYRNVKEKLLLSFTKFHVNTRFSTNLFPSCDIPLRKTFILNHLNYCFPALVPRDCETDYGTQNNLAPIHKEDRFDAKDRFLEEDEGVESLFSGEEMGEICGDIYLEDLWGFNSQFWNCQLYQSLNWRALHHTKDPVFLILNKETILQ